jgi:hypothetical protein
LGFADHAGGGGVAGIDRGAQLPMSTDVITILESELSDMHDLPLDAVVDVVEYNRIMRRIGVSDGEPVTPVSAFNSSI